MEARKNGVSDGAEYGQLMELSLPTPPENPRHENPNIARARELVLAHGWNSTSFQIINPGIQRWFSAVGDAVVGYVSSGGVRVVAGAPVCEKERLTEVAGEFEKDAANNGQHVCYFAAETRLESIYTDSPEHTKFLIGAQPAWQPQNWESIIAQHRSLRSQLNRARNKNVTVSEWPVEKAHENPELNLVLKEWLASKGLPPLHFMVESDTLSRLQYRRIFVAKQNGAAVGYVVLSPVAQRNGWLFEQFPHRPGSPNGTVELMIDAAMRALAVDDYEYATLGLSPLSTRADVGKFDNPVWLRALLAWLRKHGQRFYNFDGLDAFKAKLRPDQWEPVFAVSNEARVSFKTLYAIASAFSGNEPIKMFTGGFFRAAATEISWLKHRVGKGNKKKAPI
jgi:phosphatidylglycerol lysyltransferase